MNVAATLLDRTIVVYDDRDRLSKLPGVLTLFSPGCNAPFKAIGKEQARKLANKNVPKILKTRADPASF